MSADETMTVSATGGQKAGNLERYDLIPQGPLNKLAEHCWKVPPGKRGSFAELHGHLTRFWQGTDVQPDTLYDNVIGVAWHALRLVEDNVSSPRPWPHDRSDDQGGTGRYDLIPAEPLRLLALHYGKGGLKYGDNNWRLGYEWSKSFAALSRHLWQWWAGQEIDQETGSPHLIAVAWHALTLSEWAETHPEFDNRLKTLDARAIREPLKPEPREVPPLFMAGPEVCDAVWRDAFGNLWRWDKSYVRWQYRSSLSTSWFSSVEPTEQYGPYVEVLDYAE